MQLAPLLGQAVGPLHLGVARGLARRIPDRFDGQPDQPQRQFGRQVAGGAPGIAVVDAYAVGEAPTRENVAEHRLDRLRGDVFPPAVGGNFGGQDGPRGFIGHRQPADALAGGQRHVLDGVDLPDLVGLDRLGDHDGGPAAAPRPIDSGPHEGELEASDRGQVPLVHVLAELEPDQPGAQAGWSRLRSQAIWSSSWIRGGTGRPQER